MATAKKPKPKSNDPQQSKRFVEAAQKLVDAGELNPTEAGERVGKIIASTLNRKSPEKPRT